MIAGLKCKISILKYRKKKIALLESIEVKTVVDLVLHSYFLSDDCDDNTFVGRIERSNALNVAGRIRMPNS